MKINDIILEADGEFDQENTSNSEEQKNQEKSSGSKKSSKFKKSQSRDYKQGEKEAEKKKQESLSALKKFLRKRDKILGKDLKILLDKLDLPTDVIENEDANYSDQQAKEAVINAVDNRTPDQVDTDPKRGLGSSKIIDDKLLKRLSKLPREEKDKLGRVLQKAAKF